MTIKIDGLNEKDAAGIERLYGSSRKVMKTGSKINLKSLRKAEFWSKLWVKLIGIYQEIGAVRKEKIRSKAKNISCCFYGSRIRSETNFRTSMYASYKNWNSLSFSAYVKFVRFVFYESFKLLDRLLFVTESALSFPKIAKFVLKARNGKCEKLCTKRFYIRKCCAKIHVGMK